MNPMPLVHRGRHGGSRVRRTVSAVSEAPNPRPGSPAGCSTRDPGLPSELRQYALEVDRWHDEALAHRLHLRSKAIS
jgi:hypothetical protein